MKVELDGIDQSLKFKGGRTTTYASLLLPSGKQVRAVIPSEEDVASIIAEAAHVGELGADEGEELETEAVPNMPTMPAPPPVDFEQVVAEPNDNPFEQQVAAERLDTVNWTTLPETQLPPMMREVFEASGIEPVMTLKEFENLKLKVLERLRNMGKPQPGEVSWNQGTQRTKRSTPRRTVPMDEAGNPLPPGGIVEADPGEGPDDDEDDGVPQL